MYRLIGLRKLIFFILVIYTPVYLLMSGFFDLSTWKPISVTLVLVGAIGQTRAFVWLCRQRLIRDVFPPIEGSYVVEISSNWNLIAQRLEADSAGAVNPNLLVRKGKARVRARLLSVQITLEMDDGYLRSNTLTCDVRRSTDGTFQLMYVYESTVDKPLATDSAHHFGAALVRFSASHPIREMKGTYWTDRNWHKALNTAGEIRLVREA